MVVTKTMSDKPTVETRELSYRYGGGATIHTRALSELRLDNVNVKFEAGSRVLVAGANGAGKSTLLSILGGKKMVPEEKSMVLGQPTFHDTTLDQRRMYCGDWWRTNFFHNLTAAEVVNAERLNTPRAEELIDLLQVNKSWRINAISDGQRRRVQLLDALLEPKEVYILDEITTDLDVCARTNLLAFLKRETERGATVLYATHIFDQLADWATHFLYFSGGKVSKACAMADLEEYHALVKENTKAPLFELVRRWVCQDYPVLEDPPHGLEPWAAREAPVLEMRNMTYAYGGCAPVLKNCSLQFHRGNRVLVVGANGSCKSTFMSILGGKRMVPAGDADVMGRDCFNEGSLEEVTYCGDWWGKNFFMNLTVRELLGNIVDSVRVQHLAAVLQVDLDWKINTCSDGQRRRSQLLNLLATPRPVYLMDEITSDLDLFARQGVMRFLQREAELGACVLYCTHIFDHLEGWPTHVLHMQKGRVEKIAKMEELPEYAALASDNTPLGSLVRGWLLAEAEADEADGVKPWRAVNNSLDGRLPNLGLAGPLQMNASGLASGD